MVNILDTVLTGLGVDSRDSVFTKEIEIYISSTLSILDQLGAINNKPFTDSLNWEDIKKDEATELEFDIVKTYVLMKVRLFFDPPTGTTLSYWEKQLENLEWRIREFFGLKNGGD